MADISVNDVSYKITKVFVRTPGSRRQRLYERNDPGRPKCCPSCEYFLATSDDVMFWIKHPLTPYNGVDREARQARRFAGMKQTGKGMCGAVEVIDWDKKVIVFEYLDGFTKLTDIKPGDQRRFVGEQVFAWMQGKDIEGYDLSENNVMVRQHVVKMIDFAPSSSSAARLESRRRFMETLR